VVEATEMKTAQEVLIEVYDPSSFGDTTSMQDLQIAVTLNPEVNLILLAMEKYAEQFKTPWRDQ
jgi:hypothetical protein